MEAGEVPVVRVEKQREHVRASYPCSRGQGTHRPRITRSLMERPVAFCFLCTCRIAPQGPQRRVSRSIHAATSKAKPCSITKRNRPSLTDDTHRASRSGGPTPPPRHGCQKGESASGLKCRTYSPSPQLLTSTYR